jgi:hypothetical protein
LAFGAPAFHDEAGGVVPLQEGELLLAMGGIVGVIQIDRNVASAASQPPTMPADHHVGERVGQPKQLAAPDGVLEARERRL